MAKTTTVDQATGGVALAEPPSSAATVLMPALEGLAMATPNLPAVFDVADPPVELSPALGLAVVERLAVHRGPIAGLAVNADGSRLVVTNYGDDSVSVVDPATCTVDTITGIGEPSAIAIGDGRAYVGAASPASDAIAVIDVDDAALTASHRLALSVRDLAVGPGGRVFALRTSDRDVDVAILDPQLDLVEAVELAGLGVAPDATVECLAVGPDGQRLYVAAVSQSCSEVLMIDLDDRSVVGTVEIGSAIRAMAISADGETLYVGSDHPDVGGMVDVVDTATAAVVGTIEIGGLLTQLTLSRDGERIYVVTDDAVTVVCALTYRVAGALVPGVQPSCVTESPDGSHLYVADCAGVISAVSMTSTVSPVAEHADPGLLRELDWALA